MTFYDVYDTLHDALFDDVVAQLKENGVDIDEYDTIITAEVNRLLMKASDIVAERFDKVEHRHREPEEHYVFPMW